MRYAPLEEMRLLWEPDEGAVQTVQEAPVPVMPIVGPAHQGMRGTLGERRGEKIDEYLGCKRQTAALHP